MVKAESGLGKVRLAEAESTENVPGKLNEANARLQEVLVAL